MLGPPGCTGRASSAHVLSHYMNIGASAAIDASSDPKPSVHWACFYRLLGCGHSLNIGLRFVVDLSLRIGFDGFNECVVVH